MEWNNKFQGKAAGYFPGGAIQALISRLPYLAKFNYLPGLLLCLLVAGFARGNTLAEKAQAQAQVTGFADLHVHQMAEFAYAGAWFHGAHQGEEGTALKACSGGSIFGGDHARTVLTGIVNENLGKLPGTQGDTGLHEYKKQGYPGYSGWPRWDSIAHQQVWEGHLQQAHEAGLNLYIMSAVDYRQLCDIMPSRNKKPGLSCDEMLSVDKQLDALIDFAQARDWLEIATTPEQARGIINQGKLAAVMGIEVSHLFEGQDWQQRLEHYFNKGVRSIQPVHQADNRFGGAAPHHFIFKLFQYLEDIGNYPVDELGFELDEQGKNIKGLTEEGKQMVDAMIDKHMLIDLAHMSERSVADTYAIAKSYGYYPLMISHGHLRAIMMDDKQKEEKTTPDNIIAMIRETGGMFGLRTGAEQVKTYNASAVENDCDGSVKSFAQAYEYGALGLKVKLAFASDMNGFIQQLRPRFGNSDETCGASGDAATVQEQIAKQQDPSGTPLDQHGFAHIGLAGDIITELNNLGVNTGVIESSAENFIRMWERAYDSNRSGPLDISDMVPGGIE
ncbi:membrane dipeptidase [Thalassomonas viridans]|uniref:Membrane dipeptidase n=1 Tax=Thalassomonas viridans TaxID=137584 RepID=A0AAE9Z5Z3_9GAMM|nr:membrane dipeptidase [Thalassomonas viridans]WDE05873.1 membrane dipeptidase [Thalassomonas viridans]